MSASARDMINLRSFKSILSSLLIVAALFFVQPLTAKSLGNLPEFQMHDLLVPNMFSAPMARPSHLLLTYDTPQGHFTVHYMNSGDDAVEQSYDQDPLVPDYVINTGNYLEKAYLCLKDTLGIKRPPVDNAASPRVDIYIMRLSNTYAETWLENKQADNSWTAYMLVNNSFDSDIFETHGEDALKVSCAHELFHVFQLGYGYRSTDRWYMEMSSVWFEERLYPQVNDYFQYVEDYSTTWRRSINHSSQWYNNVGYNLYLEKRFSSDTFSILEAIWSHMDELSALGSIAYALDSLGVSFPGTLADWGRAQVLCGDLSDPDFSYAFDDADSLAGISFTAYPENIITDSYSSETVNDSFITSYYSFQDLSPQLYILNLAVPVYSSAVLILSNGHESESRSVASGRYVVDGRVYDSVILSYGSTEDETVLSLHLESISGPELTGIYPNPVSGGQSLSLEYLCDNASAQAQFSLYDIRGRLLRQHTLASHLTQLGQNTFTTGVQDLASGVYLAVLDIDGTRLVKKFTVISA